MRNLFNRLAYPFQAFIHHLEQKKYTELKTREIMLKDRGYYMRPNAVWPLSAFHALQKKHYPDNPITAMRAIRDEKWRLTMRSINRNIKHKGLNHFMPKTEAMSI